MNWFNQNQAWLLPLIGAVSANVLTPMIRKLPDTNPVWKIVRALLSGVPKEPNT